MRISILIIAFLCKGSLIYAQIESFIPYPDSTVDQYALSHRIDSRGNVYLLCQAFGFYSGPNTLVEGPPLYGSILCKINPKGQLIWQSLYQTVDDSLFRAYEQFPQSKTPYLPTERFFLKENGDVVLPYGIYTGINHWNIRRNAVIVADANTGIPSVNHIFSDTCCSFYEPQTSYYTTDALSYFYSTRNFPACSLYYAKWNTDFNQLLLGKVIDTLWDVNLTRLIKYDEFNQNYLIYNYKSQISIYNKDLEIIKNVNFYDSESQHYITVYNIEVNADYYAINYYASQKNIDSGNTYLTILDKGGRVISTKVCPRYSSIIINKDNTIWAILYQPFDSLDKSLPVTIIQMDLQQNAIRKTSIGRPYVVAGEISIFNDDEIVVSGTYATSSMDLYPNKKPGQLYLYRRKIWTIPTVSGTNNCKTVTVSPNPTNGLLHISVSPQGQTEYTATLTNFIGQEITKQSFTSWTSEMDLKPYSSGMYFLHIKDVSLGKCVSKIVKQ